VGVYQVGLRFLVGALQVAAVLGNVFIPSLSRSGFETTQNEVRASQLAFAGIGLVGGLAFAAVPPHAISRIFGEQFADAGTLFPLFGMLFAIRMQASAWGMLLTVMGAQGKRSLFTSLHWAVALALAIWLVPLRGADGWLISLILANTFLAVGYLGTLLRTHARATRGPSLCLPAACLAVGFVALAALTQYEF